LTGKLSHSVFADHAFDLQHNGGCVFGKNQMIGGDRYRVHQLLDAKKNATSVGDLYQRLTQIRKDLSPEVEALYRKGEQLGLWAAKGQDRVKSWSDL
jgi:hypothetical protein